MSEAMELGAFSVSLNVKDLETSKAFYEKLGFEEVGGDGTGYYILANGPAVIGLFHGMFEKNILTFNPGLTQDKQTLDAFTDVRDLRERLVEQGLALSTDLDPESTGPAHVVLEDPDGNPILIDQFFPRPS